MATFISTSGCEFKMKVLIGLAAFFFIIFHGPMKIFSQQAGDLDLVFLRQEDIKPEVPHSILKKKAFFRIFNGSGTPITIFGDEDEPSPRTFSCRYDYGKNVYVFSNGRKKPNFDTFFDSDEKKETFVLGPNQSVEFEKWFEYSCENNRFRLALFFLTKDQKEPGYIVSDEIIPDSSSLTCNSK